MRIWSAFRIALFVFATLAYVANGAQAHLKISAGETLNLQMCTTGSAHTVTLDLPGEPAQETADTCCGDCLTFSAMMPPRSNALPQLTFFAQPVPSNMPDRVAPGSPLWPGAPPQGPPLTHET